MKANLIRALKNTAELVDIEPGRSARRNFPEINFDNAVLIINGHKAEPDTIIKENDIVTLRQLPGDLTETPWWVATFIIPFGFLIQPIELAVKAKQQADEAERELEKIKKLTNQPALDNSPFLRGASNTIATGKSQPYFCGRNFLTPYLFSKPYYRIGGADGRDQYVYNIFEAGFKDLVFEKLGIGDADILSFGGSTPQEGVFNINSGVFAEGVVEIRQSGQLFTNLTELNYKVVSTTCNTMLEENAIGASDIQYFNFTLNPNAKDVEVCVSYPYGLYAYDDNNDRVATSSILYMEYSLDGGSTWALFSDNPGTITRNTTSEVRVAGSHTFNYSNYITLHNNNQNTIFIRVHAERASGDKIKADGSIFYYQSTCFDPQKSSSPAGVIDDNGAVGLVPCLNVEANERSRSCIIALKLKATDSNKDKLTQFNFIATSTARTWDGSAWSEGKSPTRNPAALALEILTSDTHPASRYADSEIDLDAFGALYEYCETNDIYFDYVITQNQKKDATLQLIADVCGCAFYKDIYGRRSVAIDQVQENALAVYNPQNIISLTNKKTFARRVDALRVKYTDSSNSTFKENTYTVTRLENGAPVTIDENSIIKEVTAPGVTRYSQVVKYARRLMAIDELRPITTTLKIGAEGVYYTPYAKIAIQDPSLNRDAQDTIIEGVQYQGEFLKKITLKNPVTLDPLKIYGIIVNVAGTDGAALLPLKVEGSGTTRELTLTENYAASAATQPEPGNVASVGELDANGEFTLVTHEFVITRIARTAGGFNLDLQEYNEAIYEPGVIPAYKPIVNNTPTPSEGTIPPESMTAEEVFQIAGSVQAGAVQAAVDTIQKGYRFTNVYNVRPVDTPLEEIIAMIDAAARDASASIQISESEILLQVQDMERELVGLISVQAGAVTALVEGGGATGQMSLSLNLPVMIDATRRAQLIAASTEAKVNAVYGLVSGTEYYGIKGNASSVAVKALWDDAVAAGLLASQIELQADQIYLNGEVIVNDDSKIKAALIDVDNILATDISVKDKGVIHSDNYNGTIDENGNITEYGSAGWAIDHAGKADFVNINATGGLFNNVNINGSISSSKKSWPNGGVTTINVEGFYIGFVFAYYQTSGSSGYNKLVAVIVTSFTHYFEGGKEYYVTTPHTLFTNGATISTTTVSSLFGSHTYPTVSVSGEAAPSDIRLTTLSIL